MIKKIIYESERITRPLPKNFHEEDAVLFYPRPHNSWPIYYDVFNHVTANTELFVKNRIKILPISFGDAWQEGKYNKPLYLLKTTVKDLLRKRVRVAEAVWVLDQFSTGGYYHWLTEILPRIWIAQEQGILTRPLYFPHYFFTKWDFGHQLLSPFKLDYRLYAENELLKIEKMHFVSQPSGPLSFQSVPLIGARDVLLGYYYDADFKSSYSKIYVSRNRGSKRRLLNEHELLPIIERSGYQIVYTEEMSIKEQINLFARAKEVLTIHGAGLTNMIFMPKNSRVIEIRNKSTDHMVNCFLALADTVNHDYRYVLGDMIPQQGELREIDYSLSVSPSELKKVLGNF
jgi:hypothetical protein